MSLKRAINIGGEDAPAGNPQQKSATGAPTTVSPKTIYVDGKSVQARYVSVSERASSDGGVVMHTTADLSPSTQAPQQFHHYYASTGGFLASSSLPYDDGGWSPRTHVQAVVDESVGDVGDLQSVRVDDVLYENLRLTKVAVLGEDWIMVEWESVL